MKIKETKEILSIENLADRYSAMYEKADYIITGNVDINVVIEKLNKFLEEVLSDNNMNKGDLRTIGIICKPAKGKGLDENLWNELLNRMELTKK